MIEEIFAAVFGRIVADEIIGWAPRFNGFLLRRAVQHLPTEYQAEFLAEWTNYINETPGLIMKAIHSLDMYFRAAPKVAKGLEQARRRESEERFRSWLKMDLYTYLAQAAELTRPEYGMMRSEVRDIFVRGNLRHADDRDFAEIRKVWQRAAHDQIPRDEMMLAARWMMQRVLCARRPRRAPGQQELVNLVIAP